MSERETFVENFLQAEGCALPDHCNGNTRMIVSLIGSIHDLQQQVTNLQEQIDELSKTVVSLRNS